jgi:hypothetical protein
MAGPTINVAQYPQNPPSPGSFVSVSGNLTQVDQALSGYNEAGQYKPTVTVSVVGNNPEKIDCCDENGASTGKVKYKIKANDMVIGITFSHVLLLAQWSNIGNFTTSCPSAVSEWTRFINAVHNHEKTHHSFAKGWFTEQKVKSYFTNVADFQSQCYDESEASQKAQEEFEQWATGFQDSKAQKIVADEGTDDNIDIIDPPGVSPYIIDTSKDCQ